MSEIPDGCPYKDKECPKLDDVKHDLRRLQKTLDKTYRVLYVIVGVIAVQTGLVIM